jgi:hypothetical protein
MAADLTSRMKPLKNDHLLSQLEELAGRLEIAIRYENVITEESSVSGGLTLRRRWKRRFGYSWKP